MVVEIKKLCGFMVKRNRNRKRVCRLCFFHHTYVHVTSKFHCLSYGLLAYERTLEKQILEPQREYNTVFCHNPMRSVTTVRKQTRVDAFRYLLPVCEMKTKWLGNDTVEYNTFNKLASNLFNVIIFQVLREIHYTNDLKVEGI